MQSLREPVEQAPAKSWMVPAPSQTPMWPTKGSSQVTMGMGVQTTQFGNCSGGTTLPLLVAVAAAGMPGLLVASWEGRQAPLVQQQLELCWRRHEIPRIRSPLAERGRSAHGTASTRHEYMRVHQQCLCC